MNANGKRILIVGWFDEDELFLQTLLAEAKLMGFEVETYLWLETDKPNPNSKVKIPQDVDVIVASGLASEQWWVNALNAQSAPVVYNNWLARQPEQSLGLTVRHLEVVGTSVENTLRCVQQLTA